MNISDISSPNTKNFRGKALIAG